MQTPLSWGLGWRLLHPLSPAGGGQRGQQGTVKAGQHPHDRDRVMGVTWGHPKGCPSTADMRYQKDPAPGKRDPHLLLALCRGALIAGHKFLALETVAHAFSRGLGGRGLGGGTFLVPFPLDLLLLLLLLLLRPLPAWGWVGRGERSGITRLALGTARFWGAKPCPALGSTLTPCGCQPCCPRCIPSWPSRNPAWHLLPSDPTPVARARHQRGPPSSSSSSSTPPCSHL